MSSHLVRLVSGNDFSGRWFGKPAGTIFFVIVAIIWLSLIAGQINPGGNDLAFYRRAAEDVIQTGNPYTRLVGYVYPPFLAYLLQPITLLPTVQAQYLWFGLNTLFCAVFFWLSITLSGSLIARQYWALMLLGLAFFPPLWINLQIGQVGGLIAFLLLTTLWFGERRPAAAGFFLAVAIHIKLYPGLLALHYALYRPRAVALWTVVLTITLFLLTVAVYGLQPYVDYVTLALPDEAVPLAAEYNVSPLGLWSRLLSLTRYSIPLGHYPRLAQALTLLTNLMTVALCLWVQAPADKLSRQLHTSIWLCALMLLAPVNGYYNLLLLFFPFLVIVRYLEWYADRDALYWLLLATLLVWLPSSLTNWHAGVHQALHTGWGVLLLTPALYGQYIYLLLLVVLLRRHGRNQASARFTAAPSV
jgi:hypothetical protein